MAVVWDSILESEFPAMTSLGGYDKIAREGVSAVPVPATQQHHHHFHYPSGVYHALGSLSAGLQHKKHSALSWAPNADIRETKLAYHIEMEVPGVADKKSIKMAWLSPNTFQVDGLATRPDLVRGREGDGDPMWESDVISGGSSSSEKAGTKSKDSGPRVKCTDSENEMTTLLISGERKIGPWRRIFTLPLGCDMSTLKAKLDAGMLRISVFKKAEERHEIEVE